MAQSKPRKRKPQKKSKRTPRSSMLFERLRDYDTQTANCTPKH